MPSNAQHPACRARAAYTLAELLVASVAGSMLLAGLASTMYIAGQVAYSPVHAQRLLHSTSAAFELAEELKHAIYIVNHGATYIEFVTDDRNGDGLEETHRYGWSGVAGDPLTKALNRGAPVAILDDVHDFHLHYSIAQGSEEIDVVTPGAEIQLDSQYSTMNGTLSLGPGRHLAQPVNLNDLPSEAASWMFTKLRYHAKADGGSGEFAIQLRTASSDGTPTSEILAQEYIPALSSDGWFTFTPAVPVGGLSPHENYCIVFAWRSGQPVRFHLTDQASGALETTDDGATWSPVADRRLRVVTSGRPVVPDTPLTLHQDRLQSVKISLQRTASAHARIDTAARLGNEPLLARGFVGAEFDSDPTAQDANGDGRGDFTQADGGAFDTTSLTGGWWNASAYSSRLIGELSDDTTLPVDVRFRAQATTVGTAGVRDGANVALHLRLSGTEAGQVAANLWLDAGGTQVLDVWSYNGSSYTRVGRVNGITSEPVEVRLVADPARRICVYFVNGVPYASVPFPAYSEARARHEVTIFETNAESRFDYVQAIQPKDG